MVADVETDANQFESAWTDFAELTAQTVAPEATYQAWLAHHVIRRFEMLRVVREVDFGTRYFGDHRINFSGPNVFIDIAVLREPKVNLPRRSWLAARNDEFDELSPRSGLARLSSFSVISELKVSSSQGEGMDYGEVVKDFQKLSAILDRAETLYPENALPAAFVGVLDNHPRKRFNFNLLADKVQTAKVREDVRLIAWAPTPLRDGTI